MDEQAFLAELTAISQQLRALHPGATEERSALLARRAELRARAAEAWGKPRTRSEVTAELRHLEELLDELLEHGRIDQVKQAGGGAGGGFGFTADTWELNRQIDAAHDREGLERRIRELREELADLDERGS